MIRSKTLNLFRLLGPVFAGLVLSGCLKGRLDQPLDGTVASLGSVEVLGYTTTQARLRVRGQYGLPSQSELIPVRVHDNAQCTGLPLARGTRGEFIGQGLTVGVSSVEPTDLYIISDLSPKCLLLTRFLPDFGEIPAPRITSTQPASPSRTVFSPALLGEISVLAQRIRIYRDSGCSGLLADDAAENFRTIGVQVLLAQNQTTVLYGQAEDAFGRRSVCSRIGEYTHDTTGPSAPTLVAVIPASPNNITNRPRFKGTVGAGTAVVAFFSDPGCESEVGRDTAANFVASGVETILQENHSTTLYVQAFSEAGAPSPCSFISTYTHDTVPPDAPSFTSISPTSPTRLTSFPRIQGLSNINAAFVRLFRNNLCTQVIGNGTRAQFEGVGVVANVTPNATTSIFAQNIDAAGNGSTCVPMAIFTHNTVAPDPAVFSEMRPASPNNQSVTPRILGVPADRTVALDFYSDETCTAQIGAGTVGEFVETGITVQVTANSATTVYSVAIDQEGNRGACTPLTEYRHSNLPAPVASFTQASPASPGRTTTRPVIVGSAPATVSSVRVFSDSQCVLSLGSTSRMTFISSGLQVEVVPNAVTSLYVETSDVFGNTSPCVLLTQYTHTDRAPNNPLFLSTDPASPNRTSTSPLVRGNIIQRPDAVLPAIEVRIFDSPICTNALAQGTVAEFTGPGIAVPVAMNSLTTLYGVVSDAAGNWSDCQLLTNYVHNTIAPGRPQLLSASPASPSYTRVTSFRGNFASSSSFMPVVGLDFFTDAQCTTALASVSPTLYLGAGAPIEVPANQTSAIYGQTRDEVGNLSTCHLQVNFRHTDMGPSGLTALLRADGAVILNWSPDTVASPQPRYIVRRSLSADGPASTIATDLTSPSFTDTAVENGRTYHYSVAATNATGTSRDSARVSVPVVVGVPNPPLALTVDSSSEEASLSWTSLPEISFFQVLRAEQSGGPYTILQGRLSTSTYIDRGLVNGTGYFYVVRGINAAGRSLLSNEVSTRPRPVPTSPLNLTLSIELVSPSCGNTPGIRLMWSGTGHRTRYAVLRSFSPGGGSQLAQTTDTHFVDCSPWFDGNRVLQPNYYQVVAQWGSSDSEMSNTVSFTNNPVMALNAFAGDARVLLEWSPDAEALSYVVERATNEAGPFSVVASGLTSPSWVSTGLVNGTTYHYRVYAEYPDSGRGWPTVTRSVRPGAMPAAPSGLVIAPNETGAPVLSWTRADQMSRFNVLRATAVGGPYTLIARTGNSTYTDSSPPSSGLLHYRVTAAWADQSTGPTNTVTFRAGQPTQLVATPGSGAIGLSWIAVSGASSYAVQRATSWNGPFSQVGTTATASYSDTAVLAGQGYHYRVLSRFADLTESQPSTRVTAQIQGATVPQGLSAHSITGNGATLVWARVQDLAARYHVYRGLSAGGPFTRVGNNLSSNTFSASSLTSGVLYHFQVTAVVSGVESAPSNQVSFVARETPSAPTLIPGNLSVEVRWLSVTGASSYTIERSTDGVSFTDVATGLTGTSHFDLGLANGQTYFYRLRADFAGPTLTSSVSPPVTVGITPQTPDVPFLSAHSGATELTIGWSAVQGAQNYAIYVATAPGGPYGPPALLSGGNRDVVVSGLTQGITHYIAVAARIGSVESALSGELSAVPSATGAAPLVTTGNAPEIQVSWSAVGGAATYTVLRTSNGTDFSAVATGLVGTSFTDMTTAAQVAYQYRIRPVTAAALPMADSQSSRPISRGVPPVAPMSLIAQADGAAGPVRLSWISVPNVDGYRILRGTVSGGPYTSIAVASALTQEHLDTTAIGGGEYFYIIRAIGENGDESVPSSEAAIRLVDGPSPLAAASNPNRIDLTWSAVAGATGYRVLQSQTSGGPYGPVATGVTGTTWSQSSIETGVTYHFVVEADFGAGIRSARSNQASALGSIQIDLVVPVELLDRGVDSATTALELARSQTVLNPSAYDGTVTQNLEVVALNAGSSPVRVELINDLGGVLGWVDIPSNTTDWTRVQGPDFTLVGGEQLVRLRIGATLTASEVRISGARLLISQQGATRTRIYRPLMASFEEPTSADGDGWAASTNLTTYQIGRNQISFARDLAWLPGLKSNNAWELEAVARASGSAVGRLALIRQSGHSPVAGTESVVSNTQPALFRAPFEEGAEGFSAAENGQVFALSQRCERLCDAGQIEVHKAGLWIHLTSLQRVETYHRILSGQSLSQDGLLTRGRVLIESARYSNPIALFEAVANLGPVSFARVSLSELSADSGDAGQSQVAASSLDFATPGVSRMRGSVPLSWMAGGRLGVEVTGLASPPVEITSGIVIMRAAPSP
jgi:fibronectin type 3 domain-containing protein